MGARLCEPPEGGTTNTSQLRRGGDGGRGGGSRARTGRRYVPLQKRHSEAARQFPRGPGGPRRAGMLLLDCSELLERRLAGTLQIVNADFRRPELLFVGLE